ncbi:hypothetical protein ASE86_04110 [Sphingomonas sp. Leaf33]|uniref:ABC transporter permease n=1 Tax=Sphingomonas sp. Leaf33 TaxID=1736215 RepID=UPI0006FA917B|nr:ABC transporter permease [Sphingomonas sp. Leaf33]KQN25432.1 hypothetical protein ASE86_04110 [Sphingomonas sp. Leaf33]
MSAFSSTAAAIRITLSSLPARWPMALASLVGIALVVATLLGFLAMAEGFTRSLAGAGSRDVAVIVGRGVRSEQIGVLTPETLQILESRLADAGVPLRRLSAETVRVVAVPRTDGSTASIVLRGVGPAATALRPQRRLPDGAAPPQPAEGEVVLGRAAAVQLGATAVGTNVRLGGQQWRVAGIVSADGSALESEAWIDAGAMRTAFPDQPAVQSLRLPVADPAVLTRLAGTLANDPRLSVRIEREDRFFAGQSAGLSRMLRGIGWPLAIAMAVGALAGALNTMFSSVAARAREIATLRAIGFGPGGTFVATFTEALVLALAGAALGVAIVALFLDGRVGSTLAGGADVGFAFQLTPAAIGAAFLFAAVVGVLGGAAPAFRAARQPILAGLASDSQ